MRERHRQVCLLHASQPETKPTTLASALTRNRTSNISVCGTTPNQLSHTGEGCERILEESCDMSPTHFRERSERVPPQGKGEGSKGPTWKDCCVPPTVRNPTVGSSLGNR